MVEHSGKLDTKSMFALLLMWFVSVFVFLPRTGHMGDLHFWQTWALYIFENGLGKAYSLENLNYPPIFLYVLYIYGKWQGTALEIEQNIAYLKLFSIAMEMIGVAIAILLAGRSLKEPFLWFVALLNVGLLYNSFVWGQVDGILATFCLMSVYFMVRHKLFWGIFFLVMALNVKIQAILFVPIIGLLLLMNLRNWKWQQIVLALLGGIVLQCCLILPFILAGEAHLILNAIRGMDLYPMVTMGAYNGWYYFIPQPLQTADALEFGGISYKIWGIAGFFTFSALILVPFLKDAIDHWRYRNELLLLRERVCLAAGLVVLGFFYFNTQMHERYNHTAIIFFACYGFLTSRYGLYFLVSIACFLNMESVLKSLALNNYKIFVLSPIFISSLFLIAIIWGTYRLFRYQMKSRV